MSQSREKLIKELDSLPYHNIGPDCKSVSPRLSLCTACLADFILADRKRVIKGYEDIIGYLGFNEPHEENDVIIAHIAGIAKESIKNAGV